MDSRLGGLWAARPDGLAVVVMAGKVLATYPSSSSSAVYEIRLGSDGVTYCSCRGWTMSKLKPKTCKHLEDYQRRTAAAPVSPVVAARVEATRQAVNEAQAVQPPELVVAGDKPRPVGVPKAMLAHDVGKEPREPWGDDAWVSEVKLDGMRILTVVTEKPRFYSRSGLPYDYDWMAQLKLPPGTILDGELVPPGEQSYYGQGARVSLEYVVFDALAVGDIDLRTRPWTDRRKALEMVVEKLAHPRVKASRVLGVPDRSIAEELMAQGVEGVVLKRRSSTYQEGKRSHDWLKLKMTETYDVVIVDMDALPTADDRIRAGWKNLRYGVMKDGQLVVSGALGVTGPPEELAPMIGRVAEIKGYGRNDETGAIRHPVFLRLREDKQPEECVL